MPKITTLNDPRKGPSGGHPDDPLAFRWRMRNSNGQEFNTTYKYRRSEVDAWECSRPIAIVPDKE